ncbi:MFS transporter [Steroidobacter sp.]|uniref:MFS transporter n=1 Tax=Steroidobacter sp. TaxID=1978227 RepID=UPI001A51C290|nr:MFS transporter [Steroidobacter sp.]MBL8264830.1 MFS transporter [Steroidobacter sp.]
MSRSIELRPILNRTPLGRYRWQVVLSCWLIAVLDGFDVQSMAFVAPVLAPLWQIPKAVMGQVLTAGVVGLLIGSLLAGRLCDRYGRRPVLLGAVLLVSAGSLLSSLAGDVTQLIVTRVLTGIGLGGVMVACLSLTAEYAPDSARASVVIAMYVGFPIGGSLAGLLAAPLIQQFGWQAVFVVGGIAPLVLIAILWRFIPESLRFSALAGAAPERIGAIVSRIAPEYSYQPGDRFIVEQAPEARASLAQLFANGRSLGTVLFWFICFANLLVLYLLINWLPSILKQAAASQAAANLAAVMFNVGGILGAVALGRAADKLGAVRTLTAAYFLAAITVWLLARSGGGSVLAVIALAGAGVMGAQFCVTAVVTAFYPTEIRSTGVGAALGFGRVGSLAGPLLGGWALGTGMPPAQIFVLLAIPMLACGLATLLLSSAFGSRRVVEQPGVA